MFSKHFYIKYLCKFIINCYLVPLIYKLYNTFRRYSTDGSANYPLAYELFEGQTALNLVEAEGRKLFSCISYGAFVYH